MLTEIYDKYKYSVKVNINNLNSKNNIFIMKQQKMLKQSNQEETLNYKINKVIADI